MQQLKSMLLMKIAECVIADLFVISLLKPCQARVYLKIFNLGYAYCFTFTFDRLKYEIHSAGA